MSGVAATLVALLRTHLELATVEFEEERQRIQTMLVLVIVATAFACFTLVALSVLVVVWLWDQYPLAAIFGVALVYLGVVMLVVAIVYHVRFMWSLRRERAEMVAQGLVPAESKFPPSLTLIIAVLLLFIGLAVVASLTFNIGPFG